VSEVRDWISPDLLRYKMEMEQSLQQLMECLWTFMNEAGSREGTPRNYCGTAVMLCFRETEECLPFENTFVSNFIELSPCRETLAAVTSMRNIAEASENGSAPRRIISNYRYLLNKTPPMCQLIAAHILNPPSL
jgi:hypothetical protein